MVKTFSPAFQRGGAFVGALGLLLASQIQTASAQSATVVKFQMFPSQRFIPCMAANPNVTPTVDVTVTRGERNDLMTVTLKGFKEGLQFDLFSLQRSLLKADGTPDPNFRGFGLAWYQSDLKPGNTSVRTILLDQPFGLNSEVNLPPTKTFHLGFWFNNPQDAAACGFDPNRPTPFNGEQKAGPLAFITRPDAITNLGPLCSKPNTSTVPATCDP